MEFIKKIFRFFALLVSSLAKGAESVERVATLIEQETEKMAKDAKAKRLAARERHQRRIDEIGLRNNKKLGVGSPHVIDIIDEVVEKEQRDLDRILDAVVDEKNKTKDAERKYFAATDEIGSVHAAVQDEKKCITSDLHGDNNVTKYEFSNSDKIKNYVEKRRINRLLHFTQETNIASIMDRGLVTRDILRKEKINHHCNDVHRFDMTDAVCASISFPNYKMFYSLRAANKNIDWVVLVLEPRLLWSTEVAFCRRNAASRLVRNRPLKERMSVSELEAMFADLEDVARVQLRLPDNFPTDPQAEILLLNGVPVDCIREIIVNDRHQKERIEAMCLQRPVILDQGLFRWRKDHDYWRS